MDAVLGVLFRWIHITSVVILVGGVFHAGFIARSFAARFRPWLWISMAAILGSGLYNLLTKHDLPPGYHMWFGIKMLLVLHIFVAGALLAARPVDEAKRLRWMGGVAFSGLAVLLISAWLRWMTLS